MICYASSFSPSGVYCCASSSSSSSSNNNNSSNDPPQQQQQQQCLASSSHPPQCDGRTQPCGAALGGGCCAPNTRCAADGCLKVYRAGPGLSATAVLSGAPTPPARTVTRTTTVVGFGRDEDGGVTVTQGKIAETGVSAGAGVGVGRRLGFGFGFGFTGWPGVEVGVLGFAVGVAYAMGFL
ncbi:hypothetical protein F4811DRAFT_519517 [Daldinia bambusicola]|nr:hypothetical protein F4811DRAFT_519517 [Daldinia bambusicola]